MSSSNVNVGEALSPGNSAPGIGGDASSIGVIDRAFRTSKIDEIEHLTNTLISPNKLIPQERDRTLSSEFQFHGTSDLCVFKTFYGCRISAELRYEAGDDRLAFVMASKGQGQLTLQRKEYLISGQQGVVFTSGPPNALDYGDDCETSVLVMNRSKIAEYCRKLLGRDLGEDIQFDTHFNLDGMNGQSWLRLFHYATTEISNPGSLFRHLPAARQQLEQMVTTGFLLAHAHNYSHALLQPQAAAAPYYVKRAEAYIEAHFAEPLSLAEIAAQSGVGARSLQNGFQNFRNMTPMAFLRSVRLQRVHRVLLAADPTSAKVTDIALDCGFNHMGEFATAYRRAFGETPRQTLARTRFG